MLVFKWPWVLLVSLGLQRSPMLLLEFWRVPWCIYVCIGRARAKTEGRKFKSLSRLRPTHGSRSFSLFFSQTSEVRIVCAGGREFLNKGTALLVKFRSSCCIICMFPEDFDFASVTTITWALWIEAATLTEGFDFRFYMSNHKMKERKEIHDLQGSLSWFNTNATRLAFDFSTISGASHENRRGHTRFR